MHERKIIQSQLRIIEQDSSRAASAKDIHRPDPDSAQAKEILERNTREKFTPRDK